MRNWQADLTRYCELYPMYYADLVERWTIEQVGDRWVLCEAGRIATPDEYESAAAADTDRWLQIYIALDQHDQCRSIDRALRRELAHRMDAYRDVLEP